MTLKNPYWTAGLSEGKAYVEREADQRLRKDLADNQRYLFVYGPRHSGTTNLIMRCMDNLSPGQYCCTRVDLARLPLTDYRAFISTLLETIAQDTAFDKKEIRPDFPEDTLLAWLGTFPQKLVLFFDEVQVLRSAAFLETFFGKLRFLYNVRAENHEFVRLQVVLSGSIHPDRLVPRHLSSPFQGGMIAMPNLNAKQVEKLAWDLGTAGVAVDPVVPSLIYQQTGGRVHLVQQVLQALWQQASDQRTSVTPEALEKSIVRIVDTVAENRHFTAIYQALNENPTRLAAYGRHIRGEQIADELLIDLTMTGVCTPERPYACRVYERVFGPNGPLDLGFGPAKKSAVTPENTSPDHLRLSPMRTTASGMQALGLRTTLAPPAPVAPTPVAAPVPMSGSAATPTGMPDLRPPVPSSSTPRMVPDLPLVAASMPSQVSLELRKQAVQSAVTPPVATKVTEPPPSSAAEKAPVRDKDKTTDDAQPVFMNEDAPTATGRVEDFLRLDARAAASETPKRSAAETHELQAVAQAAQTPIRPAAETPKPVPPAKAAETPKPQVVTKAAETPPRVQAALPEPPAEPSLPAPIRSASAPVSHVIGLPEPPPPRLGVVFDVGTQTQETINLPVDASAVSGSEIDLEELEVEPDPTWVDKKQARAVRGQGLAGLNKPSVPQPVPADLTEPTAPSPPAPDGAPSDAPATPKPSGRTAEVKARLEDVLALSAELDSFCASYFMRVAQQFSAGMSRVDKTNLLIEQAGPDAILSKLREWESRVGERQDLVSSVLSHSAPVSKATPAASVDLRAPAPAAAPPAAAAPAVKETTAAMQVGVGLVLANRYFLTSEIGRGPVAVVWNAYDRIKDEQVCLKIVHGAVADKPKVLETFWRSAQQLSALSHPAIVGVLNKPREENDIHYVVMEFLSGGNLRQWVAGGKLNRTQILRALQRLGAGLQYAHERRVFHRNIKPTNILFDSTGHARLTDFGLTWPNDATESSEARADRILFTAPEEQIGDSGGDARADVYSLGMCAMFALYGKELSSRAVTDRQNFLDALDAPAPLKNVLRKATSENPADRYATAAEMCRALEFDSPVLPGITARERSGPLDIRSSIPPVQKPGASIETPASAPRPVAAAPVPPPLPSLSMPQLFGEAQRTETSVSRPLPTAPSAGEHAITTERVQAVSAAAALGKGPGVAPPPRKPASSRWQLFAVAGVAVLAVGGAFAGYLVGNSSTQRNPNGPESNRPQPVEPVALSRPFKVEALGPPPTTAPPIPPPVVTPVATPTGAKEPVGVAGKNPATSPEAIAMAKPTVDKAGAKSPPAGVGTPGGEPTPGTPVVAEALPTGTKPAKVGPAQPVEPGPSEPMAVVGTKPVGKTPAVAPVVTPLVAGTKPGTKAPVVDPIENPPAVAPTKPGVKPVETAPVVAGTKPVGTAPVVAGTKPVGAAPVTAPVVAGTKPVGTAPVVAGTKPVGTAPVVAGTKPVGTAPVVAGTKPVGAAPIVAPVVAGTKPGVKPVGATPVVPGTKPGVTPTEKPVAIAPVGVKPTGKAPKGVAVVPGRPRPPVAASARLPRAAQGPAQSAPPPTPSKPATAAGAQKLQEAQTAFVRGDRQAALASAMQVTQMGGEDAVKAWRFVGGAACSQRDARLASSAYRSLRDPDHKRLISELCGRNGLHLKDGQFVADE